MRRILGALVIAFLFAPLFASAATEAPPTVPSLCEKGASTGDPSGSQSYTMGQMDVLKKNMNRIIYCASACYDEHIDVSVSFGLFFSDIKVVVNTQATNQCTKTKDDPTGTDPSKHKRGCTTGDTQPQVTIKTPGVTGILSAQTIGPKSRCDTRIGKIADNMFSSMSSGSISSAQSSISQLQSLSPTVPPLPDEAANGSGEITKAFTPEQLQTTAQSGSDSDVLNTLEGMGGKDSGDPATNRQALSCLADTSQCSSSQQNSVQAVGLNKDIAAQVGSQTGAPDQSSTASNNSNTGTQSSGNDDAWSRSPGTLGMDQTLGNNGSGGELQTQCGIQGIAGNIMQAESSCGAHTYQPLSSVQGPYQYLCSTWQHDTAATGLSQYSNCSYRNDTTISTQVVNGMYQPGGVYSQQYGSQCASAGLSWSSCAYAIHVFGAGGFNNMLNAYEANPSASAWTLCGSALQTAACTNNRSIFSQGGTVGGVFNNLQSRLGGTGAQIDSVAQAGSPMGVWSSGNQVYPVDAGGSPFANVNPLYGTYNNYSPYPGYAYQGYPPAHVQPASYVPGSVMPIAPGYGGGMPLPNLGGLFGQPSVNPVINQPAPSPALSISIQPASLAVGSSALVSWSTAYVNSCTVYVSGAATSSALTGNSGSTTVVPQATGPIRATLVCMSTSGQQLIQQAIQTVR